MLVDRLGTAPEWAELLLDESERGLLRLVAALPAGAPVRQAFERRLKRGLGVASNGCAGPFAILWKPV